MVVVVCIVAVVAAGLAGLVIWQALDRARLGRQYGGIIDADREIALRRAQLQVDVAQQLAAVETAKRSGATEIENARRAATHEVAEAMRNSAELREQYAAAKSVYDRLSAELSLLEQNADDISFGLYKPLFAFDSSEEYKERLIAAREQQKTMVRDSRAARCSVEWTVGNSRKDGERMQKQYSKLLLRAFNGECDAAMARVTWNNATRMLERIKQAFEAINKLGSVMHIELTEPYRNLKLEELRLEYEFEQKKHEEQEEQRALREQMKEEERVQAEIEKARKKAEDEEEQSQKALDRARKELAKAHGDEVTKLQGKITAIETALLEAQQAKQRAISRAQQTRAGHVYIISNIGSFGDQMLKIGMTRREDPMDRVRELGDASVPFHFDVHAMIPSEDAPSLENKLHRHFAAQRVNMVNHRREFFHVTVDELEAYARAEGLSIKLSKVAEAQQYRESVEIRRRAAEPQSTRRPQRPSEAPFPAAL